MGAQEKRGMNKRENAKSSIIHRIQKPLKVTIDPENHEYLKEIGVNASRLLDKAVFELRKITHHKLVLISEKNEVRWARRDSNTRSSPCEGDVMTRPVSGFEPGEGFDDFSRTLRVNDNELTTDKNRCICLYLGASHSEIGRKISLDALWKLGFI